MYRSIHKSICISIYPHPYIYIFIYPYTYVPNNIPNIFVPDNVQEQHSSVPFVLTCRIGGFCVWFSLLRLHLQVCSRLENPRLVADNIIRYLEYRMRAPQMANEEAWFAHRASCKYPKSLPSGGGSHPPTPVHALVGPPAKSSSPTLKLGSLTTFPAEPCQNPAPQGRGPAEGHFVLL